MSQNTVFSRFNTTDYTNQPILTSYSLSITPFTFKPVLDDTSNTYSNRKVYWDFGDGTFSESVTASHYYQLPGVYNVTCFLYDKNGEAYRNSFTQTVTVYDLITDIIKVVLPSSTIINYSSHISNPFTVYRFNSWQNYDTLTSTGYTINLYASGSNSPFITSENYNKDKFAHLKPYSKFIIKEYNYHTNTLEDIVVDSINTSNEEIYFNVQNNTLTRCLPTDTNACFVGTSGQKDVYFVDDLGVNTILATTSVESCPNLVFNDVPTNIFAYFNYNKLDYDNKNIPKSTYKIINSVSTNIQYTVYNQLSSSQLVITSNGLDGDGETYNTFNIDQNKFQGQKISFVVRAKDADDYPSKFIPQLTLLNSNQVLTPNTIKVVVLSGNSVVLPITAVSNFGVLSTETIGGYFRGYIESPIDCENVCLSAIAKISFYNGNTYTPLVIAHPQSKYIHSINLTDSNITDTINLTGVSTISLITENTIKNEVCSSYSIWAGDADLDYIKKFNSNGDILSTFNLSAIATTTNSNVSLLGNLSSAAPSNIAFDSNKNIWVTLFDAVSTIRINNTTGLVDRVLYPNLTNTDHSLSSDYVRLSGFGGGNSLSPSSVDVDKNDNVWVSYANPLSSYIVKYNSAGAVSLTIPLTAGYSADQLIVDSSDNVWVVYKDYLTKTTNLTGYKDSLIYLSAAATVITKIVPLVGSIGDITLDLNQLPIVTFNKNSLVRINDKITFPTTTYTISSSPFNLSKNISDLNGLAITSSNILYVISDPSKCIFSIDLTKTVTSPVTSVYKYLTVDDIIAPIIHQDSVYSYGDWSGLRWSSKFTSATIKPLTLFSKVISCTSNNFNIYPATGKYEIGKINESMDFTELYKANTFQESLMSKPALYDNFLGTIVGNISSNQNTIGKRVYEKISNFTDNVYNVDTCNISSLLSLQTLLDEPSIQFTKYNYIFPANINRVMDLASVKITRMWGESNKFDQNYNKYGLPDSDIHGINLGSQLNFLTTTLTAGSASLPIVAYEKFSKNYQYINTNILSASYVNINATDNTYKLSAYDDRWGWGLVLPNNFVSTDIPNYYTFFNYVSTFENTYIGGLINWGDENTTIDKTQRNITYVDGVFNNMITYQFAKGLNLLTSDANIDA